MHTSAHSAEGIGARAERELRRLVARYGAGEAEIARAYFERCRTAAHDRVWLTSQVGRELSRVYQLSALATQELATLGQGVLYVGSQLRGSPLDERLAAAMRRILDDEMDHGPRSLAAVPRYVRDDDDLAGVIAYT